MQPIRIVFAGTPGFAVPSLTALLECPFTDVLAVYTQPDRPAGRGRRLTASPIKELALAHRLPVEQPRTLADDVALDRLAGLRADVLVVAAYGLILPREALDATAAPLNVHASLLPRWRGAAPIQRALMAGDAITGVCIMRVVEALDAGPVWLERRCDIEPDDTGGTLHDRLAALGAEALIEALAMYRAGHIDERPQTGDGVTYAHKITAADRDIDWTRPARDIERQVRALAPAPGARASIAGDSVKVLAATLDDAPDVPAPGCLEVVGGSGLRVGTGDGALLLTLLQPPGRQPMSAAAFINGYGRRL